MEVEQSLEDTTGLKRVRLYSFSWTVHGLQAFARKGSNMGLMDGQENTIYTIQIKILH